VLMSMEQLYSKQSLTCPFETIRAIAANGCSSANADRGNFIKRLSVQPAGMSAFNLSELSLSSL